MRRALMLLVALWAAPALAQQQPLFPRRSAAPQACVPAIRGNGYFNTTSNLPFVCDGSTWVDITVAGTVDTAALEAALPVSDATALVKGSGDPTKKVRLEADGCATGTTCALTVTADTTAPIASQPITLAGPSAARTWTGDDAAFTFAARNRANAFTTTNSFIDDNFTLLGSSDASKSIRVEVDGLTTATQRIIRPPDADTWLPVYTATITYTGATAARTVIYPDQNFSVAALDAPQTITAATVVTGQFTFGSAAGAANSCTFNETAGAITCEGAAADTAEHRTSWLVNAGFDSATVFEALATNQTVAYLQGTQTFNGSKTYSSALLLNAGLDCNINSATACRLRNAAGAAGLQFSNTGLATLSSGSSSDVVLATNGADGIAGSHRVYVKHSAKALTESVATNVVEFAVTSGGFGGGKLIYTVYAFDGTDHQAREGEISWQVINKAGTETCVLSGFDGTTDTTGLTQALDGSALAASSGTLDYTWTKDTSAANSCRVALNAVSSLTQTTLTVTWTVIRNGDAFNAGVAGL